MQDRLRIKHTDNEYFHYDTKLQNAKQVIKEGNFFVKLDNNSNATSLFMKPKSVIKQLARLTMQNFL